MLKKLLVFPLTLAILITPALVQAKGSISAGKEKTANCANCHGENGNSVVATFPKLAGQHEGYLYRQLKDFKDGERNAPMMAALAMALDDQSMQDISAYYASQTISANLPPVIFSDDDDDDDEEATAEKNAEEVKELLLLGANLYRNGNLKSKVSACIACHGPKAEGNKPSSFPSIKSQHSDYIIKALTDFKKGNRSNLPDNMMHLIAKKMTEKEIKAVAFYISMMK
ncbi:MAG: cytochrome c4 [Methylococcales symbiont of Iophon sp. n. MRB-2018]|nr:MAG: cytochrome c4 [Methylococcales symbiont of Iophon sp. n. MRB-2018]KAF3979603.1 MAG: cytochrome c4 [Methylococcales symbiont of Iophon sp. n. MRB-2018]